MNTHVRMICFMILLSTASLSSAQTEPNTYEIVMAKILANPEFQKYHGNVKGISGIQVVSAGADIKEKAELNVPLPVELKYYSFANCNQNAESWSETLTRTIEQTATIKWDRTVHSTTEQKIHIEAGGSVEWFNFKTTADFLNRQEVTVTNSSTVTTRETNALSVPISQSVPSMTKKFLKWSVGKRQDSFNVSGTVTLDANLVVGVFPWGANFKEHVVDKPLSAWYPNPRDRESPVQGMVWTVIAGTTDVTWSSKPLTPSSPDCISVARFRKLPSNSPALADFSRLGIYEHGTIRQSERQESVVGLSFQEDPTSRTRK